MKQRVIDSVGSKFSFDGIIQTLPFEVAPTALDHEAFDNAVEDETSIEAGINELDEIGAGVGGGFPIEFSLHYAIVFNGDANHCCSSFREQLCAQPFKRTRNIVHPWYIVGRPKQGVIMKVLLFAILDHVPASEQLLHSLSKEGYNGTVMPTEGMHHVFPQFGDSKTKAVSLAALTDDIPNGNFTLFIVLDDTRLESLQKEIRSATEDFRKIKGGMFVLPVSSVEGFY